MTGNGPIWLRPTAVPEVLRTDRTHPSRLVTNSVERLGVDSIMLLFNQTAIVDDTFGSKAPWHCV